jgi:hypothetical protein
MTFHRDRPQSFTTKTKDILKRLCRKQTGKSFSSRRHEDALTGRKIFRPYVIRILRDLGGELLRINDNSVGRCTNIT